MRYLHDVFFPHSMSCPDAPPAVFDAHTDADALRQYLQQHPDALVVACYCAAWCKTCVGYRRDFDALAQRLAQAVFVWIDIEESPHCLGDAEIENFPTLLLQQGEKTLFFGVQQPFIHHLEGLIARSDRLVPAQTHPSLRDLL